MLSVREDLKTREAADAYNKRISDWRCEAHRKNVHPGCVGAMACIHCYHVISDSICLCAGSFVCPKCGKQNGRTWEETTKDMKPISWGGLIPVNDVYTTGAGI
jgi:hypothetical protein